MSKAYLHRRNNNRGSGGWTLWKDLNYLLLSHLASLLVIVCLFVVVSLYVFFVYLLIFLVVIVVVGIQINLLRLV